MRILKTIKDKSYSATKATITLKTKKYYAFNLFCTSLIERGKKAHAEESVSKVISFLKQKNKKRKPKMLIFLAVSILSPLLELRAKKVAGQKVFIPAYLSKFRAYTYSVRWLIECAEKGNLSSFEENLAHEVLGVVSRKGNAYKKKLELYKEIINSKVHLRYIR